MSEENNIRVSCKLENLAVIRGYLRKVLANLQIDELVRDQIVLAVDEVCANLIVHSNKADVTQHIELSLTVSQTPKGVLIELRESGEIFDYHNYKEPLLLGKKGLGIAFEPKQRTIIPPRDLVVDTVVLPPSILL